MPSALWSIEHDVLEEIRDHHLNTKYLDGVQLHDGIEADWDIGKAVDSARLVILSVPSQIVPGLSRRSEGPDRAGTTRAQRREGPRRRAHTGA